MAQTMTISEAARALGVSDSRVRQLIRRGSLAIAPGSVPTRVLRRAVDALATERSTPRRAGGLFEAGALESLFDRVLVKRLRPLRADAAAARRSFEEQVVLRHAAEARAERAEQVAATLRVQVAELETRLAALDRQPAGWFRRRRVAAESTG